MSFLTMKNELSRDFNQHIPLSSMPQIPQPPPPPPPPSTTTTTSINACQRFIDSNAIDITSIKGQFAWEKIPHSDTCIPVIFRYVIKISIYQVNIDDRKNMIRKKYICH